MNSFARFRAHRRTRIAVIIMLVGIALLLTGCVEALVGTIESALVVESTPGGVSVPEDGSAIGREQAIRIRFSEGMEPSSVAMSGTLVDINHVVSWESIVENNDTLVLEPQIDWPLYQDLDIVISARSTRGFESRDVTASFTVVGETIHVSTANGSVDGVGSPSDPILSIGEAMDRAQNRSDNGFAELQIIRVAAGSYLEAIELSPNVELYGGYTEDFLTRTPGTTAITGPPGSLQTVYVPLWEESLFEAVIDGFEIRQPEGQPDASLVLGGNLGTLVIRDSVMSSSSVPTLSVWGALTVSLEDCTVVGPDSGTVAIFSDGARLLLQGTTVSLPEIVGQTSTSLPTIWLKSSSAEIERSAILAPRGEVGRSIAILIEDSDTVVRDSLLDGGSGLTTTTVLARSGAVTLENLTVRVGTASTATLGASSGIDFRYFAENESTGPLDALGVAGIAGNNLSVRNTIVFGTGAPNSIGIAHGDLVTIRNNVFHQLASVVNRWDAFGSPTQYSATELNDLADVYLNAADNQEIGPQLANDSTLSEHSADWQLQAASPEKVRTGGTVLERTGIDTRDYAGVDRGDVWSIGAYEYE